MIIADEDKDNEAEYRENLDTISDFREEHKLKNDTLHQM